MRTLKTEELKAKMENDEAVVIEVLKEEDYNKSHIKGAINIPLRIIGHEAEKRFDKDEPIVVYCSDKDCSASPAAAKKLEDLGFTLIYHFKGGKKAWKEAELPMES